VSWPSGGDPYQGAQRDTPPDSRSESPVRRRARLRAERAARGRLPLMPPAWVVVGSLLVPVIIVFSGFFLQRATRQVLQPQTVQPFQIVTPTPQPVLVVPVPFYAWLTATHPAPAPATPGFLPGLFQPAFASATPGFSLASSLIAYACFVNQSDEICLMNGDGSNHQQLTFNSKSTDWYPSFSHDGWTIVFSSQMNGHFDIFSMDLNGNNVKQITHDLDDCYAPSLSPDGSRVVFASTRGEVQNIWSIHVDGSSPVQLTHSERDNVDPVWSPDGTHISFTTTARGDGDLMIMNADGSNLRRVTHGINVEGRNSWSPDGQSLAFYAGPVGDKDIYLVEASCASLPDGCGPSQFRRLTQGGNNKGPDFSPDGQWVAFASQLDGVSNEVFIVRVDSTELHQLTFGGRADWQPRWGWHP
jgi:TolB protein